MLKIENLKPDDYIAFGYFGNSYIDYCVATAQVFVEAAMDFNGTFPDGYKLSSESDKMINKNMEDEFCIYASQAATQADNDYKAFYIPEKYVEESIKPISKDKMFTALGNMLGFTDETLSKFIDHADDANLLDSEIQNLLNAINHERKYHPDVDLLDLSYKELLHSEIDCANLEQAFKIMCEPSQITVKDSEADIERNNSMENDIHKTYKIFDHEFQFNLNDEMELSGTSDDGAFIQCDKNGSNFMWGTFSSFGEEKYKEVNENKKGLMAGINEYLRDIGEPTITDIQTPPDYEVWLGGYTEGEREYLEDMMR